MILLYFIWPTINAVLLSKVVIIHHMPHIEIEIGTPPQKIQMLLSIGSWKTYIPCVDNKYNLFFDTKKSTTIQETECANNISPERCYDCSPDLKCLIKESFEDNTNMRGYFIQDNVKFGSVNQWSATSYMNIGCMNQMRTNDRDQFGILGLMDQTNNHFPNLIDKLTTPLNKQFAICFNNSDPYMSIGRNSTGSVSIPYYHYRKDRFYSIKILSLMRIDNAELNEYDFDGPIILLSGSSNIVFGHSGIYNYFVEYFYNYLTKNGMTVIPSSGNHACVKGSADENQEFFSRFPTYKFTLENGVVFLMEPRNYLIFVDQQFYCFQVTYLPFYRGTILGIPFMNGYEFTFDQTNRQIHIKQNCSHTSIQQILYHENNPWTSYFRNALNIESLSTTMITFLVLIVLSKWSAIASVSFIIYKITRLYIQLYLRLIQIMKKSRQNNDRYEVVEQQELL